MVFTFLVIVACAISYDFSVLAASWKRNNEIISGSCRRLQFLCDVTVARIETQPDEAWEL